MCVELPKRFPPVVQCNGIVSTAKREMRCRLIDGHSGACLPSTRTQAPEKLQSNPARDGAPTLAGERKRGSLAFEKRTRVGPHR